MRDDFTPLTTSYSPPEDLSSPKVCGRDNSHRCNETSPSQRKEPLQYTPMPDYSFQQIVRDLFHMSGMTYFVYADRFSGWTEVANYKKANTKVVCDILRRYFTTFKEQRPQSNGRAESAVNTMKRILTTNTSPFGSLIPSPKPLYYIAILTSITRNHNVPALDD